MDDIQISLRVSIVLEHFIFEVSNDKLVILEPPSLEI